MQVSPNDVTSSTDEEKVIRINRIYRELTSHDDYYLYYYYTKDDGMINYIFFPIQSIKIRNPDCQRREKWDYSLYIWLEKLMKTKY